MKKGIAMTDLAPIALSFVMAGIIIVVGISAQHSIITTGTRCTSVTVNNESIAFTKGTNYTFGGIRGVDMTNDCGGKLSVTNILNTTTDPDDRNWTTSNTQITLSGEYTAAGTYLVTYVYGAYNQAQYISQNTSIGLSTFAEWMPTIGLVCAAAVIIGLVFSSFLKGRSE